MAQERQGLSRTLPKSFTFSSIESSFPRTPEHPRVEPQIPPPPRHSSYRVRRPRFDSHASIFSTMSSEPNIFDLSRPDVPVPSIEFPVSDTMSEPDTTAYESVSSEFLQVPALRRMEFKTPPAQIRTEPFNFPRATPDPTEDVEDDPIERPSSRASDSSVSSIETYTTQPSLGGSCTSPESEIYDPFSFQLTDTNKYVLETPPSSNPSRGKSADLPKRKARWTADMDNHLWNTYQMYLQDPTTTPFKTLPGSLPPLGVSHRVAREAKKTWARLKSRKEQEPVKVVPVSISADNEQSITPAEDRSGSCTPTAKKPALPRWPRSEAATRRRLKFLCKRKLSIAPHYQRLLQSRSPSPFLDVFTAPPRRPVGPAIDHNSSTTFMTRDLGVSLVSSSLPTDFANFGTVEAPTIQLAPPVETIETMQSPQQASNPPTSVIPSHVPTVQEPFPRLGSPFMYNTWGPETSRREAHSATTRGLRRDTIHVAGSRLRSPPRMELPSSVHKRRAHHRLESSPNPGDIQRGIRDLARDGKLKDGQRRVRLRNRGNTTSGGFSSKERIEQLFSPTSPFTFPGNQASSSQAPQEDFLRPRAETIRRLGSPFQPESAPRFPPRSPRHAPSLSDPFTNSSIKSQVHLHHQGEITAPESRVTPGGLPYDPTEEGLTDAERIRRQILNLPYTKNSM